MQIFFFFFTVFCFGFKFIFFIIIFYILFAISLYWQVNIGNILIYIKIKALLKCNGILR